MSSFALQGRAQDSTPAHQKIKFIKEVHDMKRMI